MNVGTEGEEEILADSQVYGLGIQEVDSLGVWRCKRSPRKGAQENKDKTGDSSATQGSGPSFPTEKWLGKTPRI